MDLSHWLDQAIKIQSIPAPTFHEAERASYLAQQFKAAGVPEVEIDAKQNVLCCIPGGQGRPIVVSAHLDTVFPPDTDLQVTSSSDRIQGPGIGDNAIAVAALLELANDLIHEPPPGDIWLVGNTGEEGLGNLSGMQAVVERFGAEPTAYVVLEGMSLGFVYHRALPVRRYNLEIKTRGGHSWIHAGRPSASHLLLQIGQRITNLPRPDSPRTSMNIGHVEGGTSINTIASHARMEIELRSEDESVVQTFELTIKDILGEYQAEDIDLELTSIGTRPGGELPGDHPLVKAAVHALEAVGEEWIALEIGSTDASWPLNRGLPAICVGLTRGGEAHTQAEYIEIEPLKRGYQALRLLLATIFATGEQDSSTID